MASLLQRVAAALQLPASFKSTHPTGGLAGYPAIDNFAAAGTPVRAPAAGQLVDVHYIPWNQSQAVGGYTGYLVTSGGTYFLTHFGDLSPGSVAAGQTIGTVGTVPTDPGTGKPWWPSHIHEGLNPSVTSASQIGYSGGVTGSGSGFAGQGSDPSQGTVYSSGAPASSTIGAAIARIVKDAQGAGLDPAALLSVAQAEGNWGVPGDSRSSFGPFSLHQGGALNASPGEQYYQQGWQYASAWAWSPEGVDYAVRQIAKAAPSGTIQDIVYNFENPGDPAAETVRAQGFYGKSKDVVTAINEGWSHNSFESTIEQGALASLNIAGTSQAQQVIGQIPVVGPAIDAAGNAINAAAGALDWLKDPTRILQLLLGGALVLLGLFLLARPGAVPA